MPVALVIAPRFDNATEYSYDWSREAVEILKHGGYTVIDMGGGTVRRRDVEEKIRNADMVVFYNHGTEDALWGSRDEPVIDTLNAMLLSGRECYTMACLSAKKLGVEAYKLGCKAYWGYCEPFSFTTDAADVFKKFANEGLRLRIIEKVSWKTALEKTRQLGQELSEKLLDEGKMVASICMKMNAENLRCYNGEPPSTTCFFRRTAIKLFGVRLGWRITRSFAASVAFLLSSLAIYTLNGLHVLAFSHVFELSYSLMVVSALLALSDLVKKIKLIAGR